jgi:hypothetical protein
MKFTASSRTQFSATELVYSGRAARDSLGQTITHCE